MNTDMNTNSITEASANPVTEASAKKCNSAVEGDSAKLRHYRVTSKASTHTASNENSTPPGAREMADFKKIMPLKDLSFKQCAKAKKQSGILERFIDLQGADPRNDLKLFLGCAGLNVKISKNYNIKRLCFLYS